MRKPWLECVAFLAVAAACGSAGAADMPLKAPPIVAAYGWTGFYLGGNLGLSVGRDPSTNPIIHGLTLAGPFTVFASDSFNLSPVGAVGGGQIGYNLQVAPQWVIGVEADLQASAQRDSRNCLGSDCGVLILNGPETERFKQKLEWLGTVRGRVGWTSGPALFYATGGLAYGRVGSELTYTAARHPFDAANAAFSQNKSGWTVGGGLEAQLAGNWTGKIEYLYVDLGTVSGGPVLFNPPGDVFFLSFSGRVQDHIFRAGVNYKFGDPVYAAAAPLRGIYKAPVAPPVVASWSGFYVGGNIGLSAARNPTEAPIFGRAGNLFTMEEFILTPRGVIGGGQIGYNWQAAAWIFGLEADFQASGQKDSNTCVFGCLMTFAGPNFETFTQRVDWFGTARARFGLTNGPAIFYATGGFAYGRINTDLNFVSSTDADAASGSFSQIKGGWTIGGGIEAQLAGNWTGKVEYLYLDLGTISGSAPNTSIGNVGVATFSSRVQDHIVRIGLNYHFSDPAVVAKY